MTADLKRPLENSLILTESTDQTEEVSLSKRLHLAVSEVIKQQL